MVAKQDKPQSDDDMLTVAKACDELGRLGFTRPQTRAERMEELARAKKIPPGVRGEDGQTRWRRGDLSDAAFEHYFGRKRPKRRASA